MPKELTHWILAERALSGLGSESRLYGIVHSRKNEYLGGAVLPDTLLHLFKDPYAEKALKAAGSFHDTDGNSYQPLIFAEARLQNAIPDPLLSCLLGVISHMLADIVFHPYVFALTGKGDIGGHYQLETDIDVYFLQNGPSGSARRLSDIVTAEVVPTLIAVAELLFSPGGELPRQVISKTLRRHICFQAMYSNAFCKLVAQILGTILGSPYNQQRHLFYPFFPYRKSNLKPLESVTEWNHPVSGEVKSATIDDLAEEAVKRTVEVFRRIEAMNSFAAALSEPPGCNLLTGMYAVSKKRMFEKVHP